jgi:hypothetical protein
MQSILVGVSFLFVILVSFWLGARYGNKLLSDALAEEKKASAALLAAKTLAEAKVVSLVAAANKAGLDLKTAL